MNYYFVTFKRQKKSLQKNSLACIFNNILLKFLFVEAQENYQKNDFDTKQINKIHLGLGMNFIFTDIYVIIHKYKITWGCFIVLKLRNI